MYQPVAQGLERRPQGREQQLLASCWCVWLLVDMLGSVAAVSIVLMVHQR